MREEGMEMGEQGREIREEGREMRKEGREMREEGSEMREGGGEMREEEGREMREGEGGRRVEDEGRSSKFPKSNTLVQSHWSIAEILGEKYNFSKTKALFPPDFSSHLYVYPSTKLTI